LLRDLDQIERLDIKRAFLVKTLELWGRFITAMSQDDSLADLRNAISENLYAEGPDDAELGEIDEFTEFMVKSIPAGVTMSGLENNLASSKLETILELAFEKGELNASQELLTASAFFYYLQ